MFSVMDDSIGFRFITRTLSQDYHVFYDGGRKVLSDETDFAPIREMGYIVPEEGPCAVLFTRNGKIFLVASGMERGKMDKAGRPIRFSFCKIYQGAGQDFQERSWGAFKRLAKSWEEAEETISEEREPPILRISLGEKADWQGKNVPVENIDFDEANFTEWLEHLLRATGRPFNTYRGEGRWSRLEFFAQYLWPDDGYLFKWTKADDVVSCRPIGEASVQRFENRQQVVRRRIGNDENPLAQIAGTLVRNGRDLGKGILHNVRHPRMPFLESLQEIIDDIKRLERKYPSHFLTVKSYIDEAIKSLDKAKQEAAR